LPIPPNTIAEGHCYKTPKNQHRRVRKIVGNQVTYESWGGNKGNFKGHLPQRTVDKGKFAKAVSEEIACPAGMNKLVVQPNKKTAKKPAKKTPKKK
jgi:hypothetical protein